MASSVMWIMIGAIAIIAILTRGIVSIIKVSKSGGGKSGQRIQDLEDDLFNLQQDLAEAKKRIEVLETIVTDQKYDLGRKIDELAAG